MTTQTILACADCASGNHDKCSGTVSTVPYPGDGYTITVTTAPCPCLWWSPRLHAKRATK